MLPLALGLPIARSIFPSPLRSAATIEVIPPVIVTVLEVYPPPAFAKSTVTLPLPWLATAMSWRPSPLKSATATYTGVVPAVNELELKEGLAPLRGPENAAKASARAPHLGRNRDLGMGNIERVL